MTGIPFQVIRHTTFLWLSEMFSKHTKFSIHTRKGVEHVCLDSLKNAFLRVWMVLCESTFEELYKQSIKENPQIKHRARDDYD